MTKLSPRGLVLTALAALALVASVTACSTGTLGVTNFDGLTLSENLKVGNGTPSVTLNGEDAYVEGTFEVDGAARFDGAVALNGATTLGGAIDLNGADLIVDADADTILDETADDNIRMTSGAATGLWNILTGNLKVGNGTPGNTLDGEDLYVEGGTELDGATRLDGAVDLNGVVTGADGLEHLMLPTYASATVTYTAAAGGVKNLFEVADGEVWLIHNILWETTQSFNATGNDEVIWIGDANDEDGFCVIEGSEADQNYELVTGGAPGWQCDSPDTRGVYLEGVTTQGGFLYEADGVDMDIYATIDETSGATLSQGAATVHIWYTRIR